MARIHGILNNASGVRPNTKIVLEAAKTTNDVVIYAPDQTITTGANGAYDFECKPSFYNVTIIQQGFPREKVGIIQVYSDSVGGSLNEFLTTFKPDDLTPQILKDCINAKVAAEAAASAALTSQTKAKESEVNAKNSEINSLNYKNETESYKNTVQSLSSDVTVKHADTVIKAQEAADSAAKASQISGLDTVDDAINLIVTPLNASITSAIIVNQAVIIKAHPLY